MRTFLRVTLLAWWLVPAWWFVLWPLIALLEGPAVATKYLVDMSIYAFKGRAQ